MLRPALLLFLCSALSAQAQTSAPIPAAAQADYATAQAAEHDRHYLAASDALHAALKQSPDCSPCLEALVRVSMHLDDYKTASSTALHLASVETAPPAKAHAFSLAAQADYRAYFAALEPESDSDEDQPARKKSKKTPKVETELLRSAEAASASGLAADPTDEPLRRLHGHILAALKRDAEASAEFTACAADTAAGPAECARTLRLAHDLDSARAEPAPAFHLKTLDGEGVSLDKLAGKVVLIDFWGTWCVYCRKDTDYIQSTYDHFPKEQFALVEIDEKDDRPVWKDYLRDNSMDGIQAHDATGAVASLFHVTGYPTYVILDANGVMRRRYAGAKGDIKGDIAALLAAQPREVASAPAAK